MHTRFAEIIMYATGGNKAAFGELFGWSPQYVTKLVKGESIGLQPILAVLEKYKDIDARWLITGEGKMLNNNKLVDLYAGLNNLHKNLHDLPPERLRLVEQLLNLMNNAK